MEARYMPRTCFRICEMYGIYFFMLFFGGQYARSGDISCESFHSNVTIGSNNQPENEIIFVHSLP